MRALALALALQVAAGCATYERGRLAAAAVALPPLALGVVQEDVEGRACDFQTRYDEALEHALRQAPGANALTKVRWSFERFCVVVRGTAVRVE